MKAFLGREGSVRRRAAIWGAAFVFALVFRWFGDAPRGIVSFEVEEARQAFHPLTLAPLMDATTQRWAKRAVERALGSYPTGSLARRLERVYIVDRIEYRGTGMGGTNDRHRRIVLMTGRRGIDEAYIGHGVHHELAHLLQDTAGEGFPTVAWLAANAPGFRYGHGGLDAVRHGRTRLAYDPEFAAQGVLSEYGVSSFHEDWATVAQAVVEDDPAFWALTARYPRLRAKARLAEAFYRRTFPGIRLRDVGP